MSLRKDIRDLPGPVWTLLAGTLINRFGGFVLVFLILYLQRLGYSAAQAGLAAAAYGGGAIAASLAGGYVADRVGRRNGIVLSMFLSAATMIALAFAESLPVIIALTILAGLAGEAYRPAASALLTDLTKPGDRVTAFAVYRLAVNLGTAIGPAVGGLLAERSFFYLFVGDAVTSVIFGVIALFALPNRVGDEHEGPPRTAAAATKVILADRGYLLFLAAATLGGIVYFQMFATFPLQVVAHGFSNAVYGALVSLNGLVVMVVELPLTTVTRRYDPRRVMAVGLFLTGAGFGLTGVAEWLPALAATVVVWTLGEIVFVPVAAAYVADIAPADMRGRYQGAWMMTFGIAHILGPMGGTALFEAAPQGVWVSCAALGALAAAGMLLLKKRPAPE